MNKVILTGNVVRDAETSGSEKSRRTNFALAVDVGYGENKKTSFVPIVAWGNYGETLALFAKKGTRLLIEGELNIHSYEKDGKKLTATDVIASKFERFAKKDEATVEISGDNVEGE
jgi:single-strand DNA-binding protein